MLFKETFFRIVRNSSILCADYSQAYILLNQVAYSYQLGFAGVKMSHRVVWLVGR
jgi:hypothetical protein